MNFLLSLDMFPWQNMANLKKYCKSHQKLIVLNFLFFKADNKTQILSGKEIQ